MKPSLGILLAVLPLLAGCLHAPQLHDTRHQIGREIPEARFDKELELSLGRIGLAAVRSLLDEEEKQILRAVRKVEVAVYAVERLPADSLALPRMTRALHGEGWQTFGDIRDDESRALVLAKLREDQVRDMMVVVLEDEELVMVRLKGNLSALLDQVLEEEFLDVPGVVTADLEADSERSERRLDLDP